MRRFGLPALIALLTGSLLAGCQTSRPAPTTAAPAAHDDGPGRVIGQKRGWVIEVHDAGGRAHAFCLGHRATVQTGLVFVAGPSESGFRLTGVTPPGTGPATLTAAFDNGQRVPFTVKPLDGHGVAVSFPTDSYEDALFPFAHGSRVAFESASGPLAEVSLAGSSWAINATDECRRMHTGAQ